MPESINSSDNSGFIVGDRTLEQAFNAVFHRKESFTDFCSLKLKEHVDEFFYKERKVCRTSKKLLGYLRFIDKVISRHLATNAEVVHSYIKEKSVLTAAKAHAGNSAFFFTDIESFFGNITEQDVRRILIRDKHLFPISDVDTYITDIASMTTWDGSLPVGFPTSPKLSNAFLFEFDNALQGYTGEHHLTYTRYSDDIIISGKKRESLLDLRNTVQDLLYKYASPKLRLNARKTRINHIGNKVKILGLVITQDGRVTMDSKYKRILESILHFYLTDRTRYNDLLNRQFQENEHSLFGLLHYVRSIDPEYLEKLQRKYGALALHTLMEDRWRDGR